MQLLRWSDEVVLMCKCTSTQLDACVGRASGEPGRHDCSDDFIAGFRSRLDLGSTSATADKFDIDTILGTLVSSVHSNPDPAARETENIRLHRYRELTAFVSVYREEDQLWLQFRAGYVFDEAPPADRKNFTSFIRDQRHNPFRMMGGGLINFAEFFVNDLEDDHHRFGTDFILGDIGVNAAGDLLDYLLVRCNY